MPVRRNRSNGDVMVLLHGLGRTPRSLLGARWWFQRAGYQVLSIAYPSRRMSIADVVQHIVSPTLAELNLSESRQVHFLTHSLGGIVFRAWAAQRAVTFPLGRTVMLAPPNQGSEIIDQVRQSAFAKAIIGPVADELGTEEKDLPRRLGAVPPGTGVIIGDRVRLPLVSNFLSGPSDGVVTVVGSQVEGMADFLTLPTDHSSIMWRWEVLRAASHFFQHGHFPQPKAVASEALQR